jgi:hypothetical protein
MGIFQQLSEFSADTEKPQTAVRDYFVDIGSFWAHCSSCDVGSLFLANLFLPRLWL